MPDIVTANGDIAPQEEKPAERLKNCEECGSKYPSIGPSRYCGDACRNHVQSLHATGGLYNLNLNQVRLVREVRSCMICKSKDSGFESGIFAVDHCHDTNTVRGALCQSCNFMLGNAKDSVDTLLSAIKYLTKDHSQEAWNQGPRRRERLEAARDARLVARLEQSEKAKKAALSRIEYLEAALASVDEDAAIMARRRVRSAGAVNKFIAEIVSPAPLGNPPISAAAVRRAWKDWSGGAACPMAGLHEALEKIGGRKKRSSTGAYWWGIDISAEISRPEGE
ncbi:endonuclease domain-containing protein [Kitasatospora fiedleri]|uniref:endonuclease domain-containing protein n=1 Tax=Kitasatospora fiedleri TaxID=2991545 RepID=UPI00249C4291|nr:endonuclease domain-containing protein [Kitasatospora fiedleri]